MLHKPSEAFQSSVSNQMNCYPLRLEINSWTWKILIKIISKNQRESYSNSFGFPLDYYWQTHNSCTLMVIRKIMFSGYCDVANFPLNCILMQKLRLFLILKCWTIDIFCYLKKLPKYLTQKWVLILLWKKLFVYILSIQRSREVS